MEAKGNEEKENGEAAATCAVGSKETSTDFADYAEENTSFFLP